jgi:hypothetical protein
MASEPLKTRSASALALSIYCSVGPAVTSTWTSFALPKAVAEATRDFAQLRLLLDPLAR